MTRVRVFCRPSMIGNLPALWRALTSLYKGFRSNKQRTLSLTELHMVELNSKKMVTGQTKQNIHELSLRIFIAPCASLKKHEYQLILSMVSQNVSIPKAPLIHELMSV